ncbi:MAG: peroxiredoxin [Hydrogenophilaceae bacterium]|nr:peroxiredoxin [Hydrogenophilaceae bacterium]
MKLILVIVVFTLLGFWAMQVSGRGRPPMVGEAAPEFSLADMDGRMHRLADYRGRWLVLYFYPKADTPGCTKQACALRDDWAEFGRLGVAVLGVSVDSPDELKAFAAKYHLPFPLLSDLSGRTAQAYGSIRDFGVVRFAKRHSFLIGPDGRIAKAYLSVDPQRHARELLADLKQFQLEEAGKRANN